MRREEAGDTRQGRIPDLSGKYMKRCCLEQPACARMHRERRGQLCWPPKNNSSPAGGRQGAGSPPGGRRGRGGSDCLASSLGSEAILSRDCMLHNRGASALARDGRGSPPRGVDSLELPPFPS